MRKLVMVEQMVSRAVGTEWVSARALAVRMGVPWRVVARALGRLASKGCIESCTEEWKSARSRVRVRMLYRKHEFSVTGAPAWLAPKPAPVSRARLVRF